MSAVKKLSTFFLHDMLFGMEVERIQEVLSYQEITPVPLAPHEILGLINLRGQIITVMDLRRRFALPERPTDQSSVNVVVRSNKDVLSLLVDAVGEVVEVDELTFEAAPETLDPKSRALIHGVHKLSDRLMHVLFTERAIELPEL